MVQGNNILIQRNQRNIYRPSGNTKNGGKYILFNSKGDKRIRMIKRARFESNRCLQNYSICNRSIVHTPWWQQHLWYCDDIVSFSSEILIFTVCCSFDGLMDGCMIYKCHLIVIIKVVYEHIKGANCNFPSRSLIICENTFPSQSVIFIPTFLQFL